MTMNAWQKFGLVRARCDMAMNELYVAMAEARLSEFADSSQMSSEWLKVQESVDAARVCLTESEQALNELVNKLTEDQVKGA